MIRRWMMDQGEEDTQDEKGVPRFWLMALNNNDITSEDNNSSVMSLMSRHRAWCMTEEPKGFKLELSLTRILILRARAMLLVRELSDISETTMAGVLATAENFEVKNASSLLNWLWLRQRQWLEKTSDGKKKKKARRLRNVEINDKPSGWVKD
ncbi:hypothetical protein HID58_086194 [Brassica napus]|uniref:Uncharacterized protein n=1 Tax=Brassica napus TaxID=3708 RepID=A0ABQ7XPR0_BRANA|nr:hypothetical protein HID58_086194 [Brassica napus]